MAAWKHQEVQQEIRIPNPQLWSLDTPRTYTLVTTIGSGAGTTVDSYKTPFGIRTIRFDADQGFFLNGKPVKLQGTCNHQDFGGVGIALPDQLHCYRIAKLKEMGSNAFRTAHNPPAPALLDACDRLGMMVMDETRVFSSAPEALSQLSRMVRRDRNHPSIILWSVGNEEPEQGTERGARICATMKRVVKRLDPSRPITQAVDNAWGRGLSPVLDVMGFNYGDAAGVDDFHRKFPRQPSVGTEEQCALSTRGIYVEDMKSGYLSAYDKARKFQWPTTAAETYWQIYDQRPFLAGEFIWTGFDYRGEPFPFPWPSISTDLGAMDTCGFPKDIFYYYQAWWGGRPVLHIFPHWNWPGKEGQEIEVWVYGNLESVELFLNGQSLGAQKMPRASHLAWKVKYAPGVLEAKGSNDGQPVLTARRETTGGATKILLRPDRPSIAADGEDVSVVEVQVLDEKGRVVPTGSNNITFQVSGPGKIIGVGNGDPRSHEPDKASERRAFNGLCVAIVQSTKQAGEIKLAANSPGLASATATIQCEQVTPRTAVA
jgi:beta-galactosidase